MNTTRPRHVLALGVSLLTVGALLSGCAAADTAPASESEAETGFAAPTDLAEPGDTIPTVTVAGGLSPYGDEMLAAAGVTRGYFDEVGITFADGPNGIKSDLIGSVTPLLNGQIDVGSGYPPALISQMDDVSNVVAFQIQDVFYGYRLLAPEGKYTTLADAMAEGQSYEEAVATVLAQLDGQDVILRDGVVPTFYQLITGTAGTDMGAWNVTYLTNPDLVRAAQAGQADFVSPTGAVEIVRLLNDGWESLIALPDVIENSTAEETVSLRATFSGYLTTTEYAEENWDTLLRYASVIYRLVDDLEADPEGTAADYVDLLNSYTGSDLSATQLAQTFDGLYSVRNFEDASEFYEDEDAPFYFDTVVGAQIDSLAEQGVIDDGHTPAELSIAGDVWRALNAYREAADEALAEAPEGELKTAALAQYEARNYLDAYRLAAAA
ncbi:hypothetical protein [Microbacterium sp.]|uniref:hypothetical protein n=1 Tax=Microbacterium sp. TaxID=51671 RepID=UPI0028A0D822|nr:hypothetical protein [Microbacterium sp.]